MVAIPLASKSDPAKREVVTGERLINLYAIRAPETARAQFYLNRTPGLTSAVTHSPELSRGLHDTGEELLDVRGATLFRINESLAPLSVSGSISGTRDIRFSTNNATNRETVLATGSTAYQYTNGALSTIGGDLSGLSIVDTICINGITICFTNDGKGYYSAVNDANSYNALNFFTVPGSGEFRGARVVGKQFVCWRESGSFFFRHEGNDADDPFRIVDGADKTFGCLNIFANFVLEGVVHYVDQYNVPRTIGQSYLPQPFGNDGVQTAIEALSDKSELRLWGYVSGDRGFLVIHSSMFCWVHDFKEQRWHERQSYQRTTWQAKHYARYTNSDLVAPDQSGDLFRLDDTLYREDGRHLLAETDTPPVTNFPNGGTINALHLDIEVGTALGALAPSEDQEPHISMQISTDGGKTYGISRALSLGTRGQWRKRVSWYRCGSFGREGFIVKFRISSAVGFAIMNLDADIEPKAA